MHRSSPDFPFINADVIYFITFSIVMLNVDLHNPGVKVKMTLQDYIKRTRCTEDTKNLSGL